MEGVALNGLEKVHSDRRRTIYEATDDATYSLTFIEVHAREPLGNHYHRWRAETFFIQSGSGVLYLYPVSRDGKKQCQERSYTVHTGHVVRVEPYVVHAFYLEPDSEIVCHATAPFADDDLVRAPEEL